MSPAAPGSGYSGTPLSRKLGIDRAEVVLLDRAPADLDLGDTGAARLLTRLPAEVELALTFHTTSVTLARRLPRLVERLRPDGAVWVCWPKQSARRALGIPGDLDDARVRATGLGLGVVDVKVAAVSEVWSGLKFVLRLSDR